MPFKPGICANPGGQRKGEISQSRLLREALIQAGKAQDPSITPMGHIAKLFYSSEDMAKACLKVLVPQLKAIELKASSDSPFQLIIEVAPHKALPQTDAKTLPVPIESIVKDKESIDVQGQE